MRRGGPSTGTLPSPGELPERTLLGAGPRGWAWWLRGQAWEVAFSADSVLVVGGARASFEEPYEGQAGGGGRHGMGPAPQQ